MQAQPTSDESTTQQQEAEPTKQELLTRIEKIEAENERLHNRVTALEQQSENIENGKDYAHDRIDESSDRLDDASDQRKNLFSRVHDLETVFRNEETGIEPGALDSDTHVPNTPDESRKISPLAQLTNLPEHVAEEELTANQQRARFVAKDVRDYADKTPKGYVLDSAAISRVLTVRDGESPHTETVSRVMDFLDQLGKDGVTTKLHKGRRIAVFDPDATNRYETRESPTSQCDVIEPRASG
jgi:cell division protein FtsB